MLSRDGIETLIPGVDFVALKDVQYRTLVRRVLDANPAKAITLAEMQICVGRIGLQDLQFKVWLCQRSQS